jgi:hypothetical protein
MIEGCLELLCIREASIDAALKKSDLLQVLKETVYMHENFAS